MGRRVSINDVSRLSNKVDMLAMKVESHLSTEDSTINRIIGRIDSLEAKVCSSNYLSSHEAASYLGISLSNLYRLIRLNSLPYYRPKRKLFFEKSKLDEWIATNK